MALYPYLFLQPYIVEKFSITIPDNIKSMDPSAAIRDLKGLSEQEALEQLTKSGLNRMTSRHEITFFGIAKEEITEPMILLLLAVGVCYTILGNLNDALTLYTLSLI